MRYARYVKLHPLYSVAALGDPFNACQADLLPAGSHVSTAFLPTPHSLQCSACPAHAALQVADFVSNRLLPYDVSKHTDKNHMRKLWDGVVMCEAEAHCGGTRSGDRGLVGLLAWPKSHCCSGMLRTVAVQSALLAMALLVMYVALISAPTPHHSAGVRIPELGAAAQLAAGSTNAPVFAYVAVMRDYARYLTTEFHTVLRGLTNTYAWSGIALDQPLDKVTWNDIITGVPGGGSRAPAVLMFVIQFHWEFVTLANLGPSRPPLLNNTLM